MDERYTWLRDRIAEERRLFITGAKLLHERTVDADAKLAFLVGTGAGQMSNVIESFERLLERHMPNERRTLPGPDSTECTECWSSFGGEMLVWPCGTIKDVAAAYRHHDRYAELWGS